MKVQEQVAGDEDETQPGTEIEACHVTHMERNAQRLGLELSLHDDNDIEDRIWGAGTAVSGIGFVCGHPAGCG